MTGELTDCFADRADGVAQLAAWADKTLHGEVAIYAGRAGLVAPTRPRPCADIASANWHATAALIGTCGRTRSSSISARPPPT